MSAIGNIGSSIQKGLGMGGGAGGVRRFQVTKTSVGKVGGVYTSKSTPDAAAKKAASQRFKKAKGVKTLVLTIRENGTKKEFTYKATRVTIANPVTRTINGKSFKSEYETKVTAVKN